MRRRTQPRLGADGEWLRFGTEAELLVGLMRHARQLGYLVFHDRVAQGSQRGFPDLVICGYGVLVFIECKGPKPRISDEQRAWLDALRDAGAITLLASSERNEDYDEITTLLDETFERRHELTRSSNND